jgi:SAM-dependent methyltransferase
VNYFQRIKCRITEEGLKNAAKYYLLAGYDEASSQLKTMSLDLLYSGRLLGGNENSSFKHLGANDVYHTDYTAFSFIFRNIAVQPNDVLVDVGCGKGRVINYWLSQNYPNKLIGLELDPTIAKRTASQYRNRPNVTIITGDAVASLPDEGTLFYFYNPFSPEKFAELEQHLSSLAQDKPVTIVYYNPKSVAVFDNDPWDITMVNFEQDFGIKRWGRINKYHDLAIIRNKNQIRQITFEGDFCD